MGKKGARITPHPFRNCGLLPPKSLPRLGIVKRCVSVTGDAYVFTASPGAIQSYTLTEAQDTLAVNCTPSTCPEGLPNVVVGTEEWAAIAQKNVLYVGYSPSSIYA